MLETILRGLRPGVEAKALDPAVSAAKQIAKALTGWRDLDAVHVIAHGAPGQINFSAGDWSVATLKDDAEDLAAIGRALADDGELRLWSCDIAAGAAGTAFIEALARATGADVAASTGRIGAAALGGTWDLAAFAAPRAGKAAAHCGGDGCVWRGCWRRRPGLAAAVLPPRLGPKPTTGTQPPRQSAPMPSSSPTV